MSCQLSAFERIRDVCNSLRSETKITARRKTGDELVRVLSDPKYQARLARDTGHDHRKICSVWRMALSNAMISAQKTMDGKPKVTAQDVLLPWRILTLGDKESAQYQPGIFGDYVHGADGGGPDGSSGAPGGPDGDSNGGGGGGITSLSDPRSKTKFSPADIQKLLTFCLNALGDESTRAVAEPELLSMLLSLCSRPDYVAHFHPGKDVEYILSEVEARLGGGGSGTSSGARSVVINSAKIFANLVYQLTIPLGFGMHMQLSSCFELIVNWCRRSASSMKQSHAASEQSVPYIYSAATNLMVTHSEQCVSLMKRNGRHLLGLAKKSFPFSTGQTRDALIEYLSAHILVCEVAGRMQGLLPGDLGDLGRASLGVSQIETLLNLITSEKQLQNAFPTRADKSASRKRKRLSAGGKKHKGTEWVPLSRRQRRHLELSARLLYFAQRYWVARDEVLSTTDPTDMIAKEGEDDRLGSENTLSPNIMDSPFVARVASKMCADRFLPIVAEDRPASTGTMTFTQSGMSRTPNERNTAGAIGAFSCDAASLPMIKSIALARQSGNGGGIVAAHPLSALAFLRLLSACADAYPCGACWSLDNRWKEDKGSNIVLPERIYQKIASPIETASVVFVVLTILTSCGGANGDHDVQMWALLCLLKLTGPSILVASHHSAGHENDVLLLTRVWSDVWNTVFRSDLKYASYTSNAFQGSIGEMVMMLLTEIASLRLADPNMSSALSVARTSSTSSETISSSCNPFFTNQSKVWTLPVFRDAKLVQSRAVFELISQVVRHVGLSDHGPDVVDSTILEGADSMMETLVAQEDSQMRTSQLENGRRCRLLAYCLRFIEEATSFGVDEIQRYILPLACECLTVLIGRNVTTFPTSFSLGSASTYSIVDNSTVCGGIKKNNVSSDEPLGALWRDQVLPLRIESLIQDEDDSFRGLLWGQTPSNSVHTICGVRCGGAEERLQNLLAVDANVVSPLLAKFLRDASIEHVKRFISRTPEFTQVDGIESGGDDDNDGMSGSENRRDHEGDNALVTKVLLSLALADDDVSSYAKNLVQIQCEVSTCVDITLKRLHKQSSQAFEASMTDLLGVFRALLSLSSNGCASIIPNYGELSKLFYEECKRYLELYAARSDEGIDTSSSPAHASQGRGVFTSKAKNRYSSRFESDSEDDDFGAPTETSGADGAEFSASDDDAFDDSDDEHLRPTSRGDKRRKSGNTGAAIRLHASRTGTEGEKSDPPHARGAWLCAAAMTVLDPSLECCKSVTDCLVWPDNLDDDARNGRPYTVDRTDALVCLSLFTESDAILREKIERSEEKDSSMNRDDDESVTSICADIIQTVRSSADTSSLLHMCGFGTAASLVQHGVSCAISNRDIGYLINILCPDGAKVGDKDAHKRAKRSLKRRPRLKVHQLQSVIRAFLQGGDYFHSTFDGTYASFFVIPSFQSLDSHVREVATQSVAAALKILPNQGPIVNSVLRMLAPLTFTSDEERIAKKFDRWIKERFKCTEGEDPVQWRALQDAKESLECTSIRCRGVIAASTLDENILRETILFLIRLSLERPALLMPCYRACEHAAVARGYANLDDLLSAEREWLIQQLLELGIELSCIPLLVSSPQAVRSLLRIFPSQAPLGQQPQRQQQRDESTGTATSQDGPSSPQPSEAASTIIDIDRLEEDRASQYVLNNASSFIPLIVLESSKLPASNDENENDGEIEQGWSNTAWKNIEDASIIIKEGKSDSDISTVLKTHMQDIYALLFSILEDTAGEDSENEMEDDDDEEEEERRATKALIRKKAIGALACVKLVVSEKIVTSQAGKISHLVVREILRLSGRQLSFGKYRLPSSCFMLAIEYVADNLSGSKGGGLFENAGSSATECILDAKRWLDEAVTSEQEYSAWNVIECICDRSSVELENTKNQMPFLVHALLGVLLVAKFEMLRPSIISKLSDVMSRMISEKSTVDWSDAQIASAMNELVLALIHIHEECQKKMLSLSIGVWRREQREARRSKGLLQNQAGNEGGDVWGWDKDVQSDDTEKSASCLSLSVKEMSSALAKNGKEYSDVVDTMLKSYDLIEMLLLKSPANVDPVFTKLDALPVPSLTKIELNALSKENYKYSLEALLLRFEDRRGVTSKELSASDAKVELEKFLSSIQRHQHDSAEVGTLDMHSRSLIAALVRLESVIRLSLKDKDTSEISYGPLLYKTIQGLFSMCQVHYPDAIRLAASRCIGELSSFDLTSFRNFAMEDDEVGDNEDDSPLVAMEIAVMSLLASYFKSSNSETAIVAKDAAKFLLRTREGNKRWKRTEDDEVKSVLGPLLMTKKSLNRKDMPGLDQKYLERLHVRSGKGQWNERDRSGAWCWSKSLWMCVEGGGTKFDDWIKDLVCAMIVCCYSQKEGSGDYFHCLLPLCAREAEFAAALFPGIIFNLLSSDTGKGKGHSSDSVRSEVAVGAADSETNRILTLCFSYLISPSSAPESVTDGSRPTTQTDTKALCLAVDTLDSLRRVVQSRWLASSKHQRNATELLTRKPTSGKKASKRKRSSDTHEIPDDSQYTVGLPPPPEWRGVPFGIVLHLSGLDVASACLRANRFASALFYAEMFADNRFGGSGGVFERMSRNDTSSRDMATSFDISGFGLQVESCPDDSIACKSDVSVALSLSNIVKTCLAKFQETDGLEGIQVQDSAIRFYENAGNTSSALCQPGGMFSNDWESLVALDTSQQLARGTDYSSNSLAITTRLKNLGLRHVLRSYMAGLQGEGQALSYQDQEKLKDQWFEESWQALQWDESLFLSSGSDAVSTTLTAGAHSRGLSESTSGLLHSESSWTDSNSNFRGLNESIYHSFNSALVEESDGYNKYVMEARRALLTEMCSTVGNESLLAALPDFSTKLRALNELQDIKKGFFERLHTFSDTLTTLGCEKLDESRKIETSADMFQARSTLGVTFPPNVSFQSQEFLMSIREVALRVCSQKHPDDSTSLRCALTGHLLDFSSLARQCGRQEVASSCLQRLRSVLENCGSFFSTDTSKLYASLRLHLEDAKLNSARGDFAAAIRTCKLVLNRLDANDRNRFDSNSSEERNSLFSDAGALCGELMVEYKVESGKNILQNYLGPASSSALEIYQSNNSTANGLRASQSHFALAEFVATLYDNAEEKVQSQEWIQAGVASDERRAELQLYNRMLEKASKENNRGKASKNRSGQSAQTKKQTEEKTKKEYRELMSHVHTLRKELKMDDKERMTVEKSVSEYLELAIESYGKALSIYNPSTMGGNIHVSKHVFRMVSLWFANSSKTSVNESMRKYHGTIPSYHFVPLAYQIFARIDKAENESNPTDFQATLRSLISKMCTDHPYHCLIQLITLANGKKIDASDAPGRSNAYLQYAGQTKVDASKDILHSLSRLSGPFKYVSSLVQSYEAIANGYIELAMFPTTKFHDKKHHQKTIALSVVKSGGARGSQPSLDRILGSGSRKLFKCPPCILTKPPLLRSGCDYGEGTTDPIGSERIDTFDPSFAITDTGIHRPKIVKCIGSMGGSFKQLVKGEDDIRQDAIMQQVFCTVNDLLRRPFSASNLQNQQQSRSSHKDVSRRLNVVTYNIVPLSPASGVLEWVDDTMPFGEYLHDKGRSKGQKDLADRVGAHSRYYPGEWSSKLCQHYFIDAPAHEKRQAFEEICKRYSPSFRYFFVERFSHSLQAWHVARTMYTRSCAVNSIVGHILGIGDRHCNNILVHQKTGEIVHIDFGIVFDQGKCLNTPETVPFRLTRNVVDGMGPSGTEGCFSLAAEATASVLRDNAETLLTILSAVVSDPLYKWSVSPLQAREVQRSNQHEDDENDDDDDGDNEKQVRRAMIGRGKSAEDGAPNEQSENEAANRAIQKIHQKLQGYEQGNSGERQSVEGQVQLLINSARDLDNLCVLYHGWAPWV